MQQRATPKITLPTNILGEIKSLSPFISCLRTGKVVLNNRAYLKREYPSVGITLTTWQPVFKLTCGLQLSARSLRQLASKKALSEATLIKHASYTDFIS